MSMQVTQLQDAIETAEETAADAITILLPDTGDLDIPSDEEIDTQNIFLISKRQLDQKMKKVTLKHHLNCAMVQKCPNKHCKVHNVKCL